MLRQGSARADAPLYAKGRIKSLAGWILPMLTALLMLSMLLLPASALRGAKEGLLLFAKGVLPALLPYFVLSQTLIATGAVAGAGRLISPLAGFLFRLPGEGGAALPLGWIGGSPSGARVAGQLMDKGALDRWQAIRLCAGSALTGPLFLVGTVGQGMLLDAQAGLVLLCASLLAALLNGLLWRGYGPRGAAGKISVPEQRQSVLTAFPIALRDGAAACLAVGAGITIFSALIAILTDSGVLELLTAPLAALTGSGVARAILLGVLELTNGCQAAAALAIPIGPRVAILAGIAGFGGLSVAMQAALFLAGRASIGAYLLQRLSQAFLGFLCAAALWHVFPLDIEASTGYKYGGFCPLCIVIFLLAVLLTYLILRLLFPHRLATAKFHPGRKAPNCPPASASNANPAGSFAHPPAYPVRVSPAPQRDPPRR